MTSYNHFYKYILAKRKLFKVKILSKKILLKSGERLEEAERISFPYFFLEKILNGLSLI